MPHDDDVERLGELLVEEGIVTHEEIVASLNAAGRDAGELGRLLLRSNAVRRRELAVFLAMDVEVPYVDLDLVEASPAAVPLVPEALARKHECVPLERLDRILCIAKANVANRAAVLELRKLTGLKVKVFRADADKVLAALDRVYGAAPAPAADLSLPLTGPADAPPTDVTEPDGEAPAISAPAAEPVDTEAAFEEPRVTAPDESVEAAATDDPAAPAACRETPATFRGLPGNGNGTSRGEALQALPLTPGEAAALLAGDAAAARRAVEAWESSYAGSRPIPAIRMS